jgi:hypothetical protein
MRAVSSTLVSAEEISSGERSLAGGFYFQLGPLPADLFSST